MSGYRFIVGALAGLFAVTQTPSAVAQDAQMPPVRSSVDSNGVDLMSGKTILSTTDLSIGPGDARGLTYSRQWVERNWHPALLPVLTGSWNNPIVTFDGVSVSFTNSGGIWVPDANDGSQFFASATNTYTFISRDGLTIPFVVDGYQYFDLETALAHPNTVIFPDGMKWNFSYRIGTYAMPGEPDPECVKNCAVPPTIYNMKRLSSVTTSAGYQLKFTYASNTLNTDEDQGLFSRISRVTGINNFVESCSPTADACALSQAWPHADYTYPEYGNTPLTMTDPAGQVWTYVYSSTNQLSGIKRPNAAAPTTVYGFTATNGVGKVSSVTRAGSTWTYTYGANGTTVTDPAFNTRQLNFDSATFLVGSDTDETGRTAYYAYCQSTDAYCPGGRLKTVTAPEGNAVSYEYDTRGNVTKTTITSKPGSGLVPQVALSTYPSNCVSQKTCNKPLSTSGSNGAVTDYTYDGTHGGVLTATAPAAAAGGIRPQVRYGYTSVINSVSGDAVYELTSVSTCRTTASCAGTADETRRVTTYSVSNLLLVSATNMAGDGSLSAPVALTYDNIGNVIASDGPLAGNSDTGYVVYDVLRRPITQVSADPDGTGPLPNRIVRYGFDIQGRANTVSYGTGNADGSTFTPVQTVTATFDSADRKVSDTITAGGTIYGVAQYSYDGLGRLDCSATRMNAGAWRPLPSSACTAQVAGSAGPDRISKSAYDAAGRVLKVTSAYGTTEAADDVTRTFTTNGQIAAATDAMGNKTSYDYDGFDRLSRTRYPVTIVGSATSSTGDYEQLGYDAGGNVTSRRLRDGQTLYYTYDALNRRINDDNPGTNVAEVDVTYTYDLTGHLLRAQDQNSWYAAYEYDALGRATRQYSNVYGNSLQYDLAGRMTRQTWDDGFYVTADYLVTGETSVIRENGGFALASFGYDDLGRRTNLTRGNGTTTGYAYDPASRLTGLTQNVAGTASDLTLGFAYNPAGQITSRTSSNDAYAWGGAANVSRGYTVNGLNQYTASGSVTPTYDARGNLTTAAGQTYIYNTRNQLFNTGVSGELFYRNPTGLLSQILSGSNAYSMDYVGPDLTAEFGPAGMRRYVYGPGTDEPLVWYEGSGTSDRRYLHADERGSIIAISNDAGAVTAINTYDEYGIPGSGNVGRFQYTGQKWIAELGMYDYKARMYSPTLGRFMQTDPVGYGDGMNWYNYVGADPINFKDPSGTTKVFCNSGKTADTVAGCGAGGVAESITVTANPTDPPPPTGGVPSDLPGNIIFIPGSVPDYEGNIILTAPQSEKKLPPCAQNFLKGRISGDPADITLHRGSPFELTGNSVTFGSDVYLAGNTFGRSDANALIHKFHEIQHTSQNARLGLSTFDHAAAYVVFGGHDASPYEQAADTFGDDAYKAYKAAGLDKTCPF